MLDVLRTLLNFETDDFKLLQLIIFGQPEMGTMIHKYPNFEDRISFDFEIGPISLEDMRGMVDHRIEVTGGDPGSWFIEKALIKIHKNTQGYPRKVTQLCHQLLLTMISEEKDEINEEMVQRVISGKIDTGGLLKQKKKNYNEIAVNKLLDVLRKDEPEDKEDVTEPEQDQIDDDDWIGGDETPIEEIKVVEEPIESPPIPKQKTIEQDNNKIDAINEKPIEKEKEIEDATAPAKVSKDDFLPTQGRYPSHVKASLLGHIPIDQTYTGIHIDRGRIITTVIHENNGLKTLLAYDIHSANDKDLDPSDNPEEFLDFVHKVKLKNVKKSKKLYTNIEDLPGRKIIYTNGDEKYAKKILTALGIIFLFEDIYDIKKANYLPKPRMKPLKKLLENYDLQPSNCVYFEDLEKNLKPAHKIGITTVHISSKNKKDNQTFIDFRFKTIIKALDVIKKSFIEGRKNEF